MPDRPFTHVRTFRVRHYECDAFGRFQDANYLRYMQETAFDASAAAGYGMARYGVLRRHWLIRATDLTILSSLHYDDTVDVKTWVTDFRRVRSRRAYELRHSGSNELVAHAMTDWAFMDDERGQPAAIPAEVISAFFPEGMPDRAPARIHIPFPSPPSGAFHLQWTVAWHELDPAGHVNNAVYLAMVEDAGMCDAANRGWPLSRFRQEGIRVSGRHYQIEYLQPALLGDALDVITWVSNAEPGGAVRYVSITHPDEGTPVLRARSEWGCVDLVSGEPRPTPAALQSPGAGAETSAPGARLPDLRSGFADSEPGAPRAS